MVVGAGVVVIDHDNLQGILHILRAGHLLLLLNIAPNFPVELKLIPKNHPQAEGSQACFSIRLFLEGLLSDLLFVIHVLNFLISKIFLEVEFLFEFHCI